MVARVDTTNSNGTNDLYTQWGVLVTSIMGRMMRGMILCDIALRGVVDLFPGHEEGSMLIIQPIGMAGELHGHLSQA